MALKQFPGYPKYRSLPKSLQNDIKAFFGSHAAAQAEGRRMLFAAGDRAGVRADAQSAVASGLGGLKDGRKFRFLASAMARLPARLRVLVGCAEVLQGGFAACDFIDVDLEASRVTMISCDDADRPIPFVIERVRVELGRQKVSVDRQKQGTKPLYFKSRFMPADHPDLADQLEAERRVRETGVFTTIDSEPGWPEVREVVSAVLGGLKTHQPLSSKPL